jgi:sugar/nucleoside kinase (ribokinase family)
VLARKDRSKLPPRFDVLVAGEINPDLILSGAGIEPRFGQQEVLVEQSTMTIGSSSAIFACEAARLGLQVALIGVTGLDLFGRFMLEALPNRGVNVDHVIVDPGQQTGLTVILNRGADRAILTHIGAMGALRAEQVTNDLLAQARHLHVGSYFMQTALQPGLPGLFRRARALGLTTSLDTNYDPSGEWVRAAEALSETTLFFPNQNEALGISGTTTLEQALDRLAELVPQVVVKLGAGGGLARAGEQVVRIPALPVEVVDTVGAGDSFDAGFLYGYLNGWRLVDCLRLAVACGSLSARGSGGTAAQPTLEETLRALEQAGM